MQTPSYNRLTPEEHLRALQDHCAYERRYMARHGVAALHRNVVIVEGDYWEPEAATLVRDAVPSATLRRLVPLGDYYDAAALSTHTPDPPIPEHMQNEISSITKSAIATRLRVFMPARRVELPRRRGRFRIC